MQVAERQRVLHVHERNVAHPFEAGQWSADIVRGLVDEVIELVVHAVQ
jgi:hypothetical protein